MEGEWNGNGGPTYKGREGRGKRESEGPSGYYGFPPDLGLLE